MLKPYFVWIWFPHGKHCCWVSISAPQTDASQIQTTQNQNTIKEARPWTLEPGTLYCCLVWGIHMHVTCPRMQAHMQTLHFYLRQTRMLHTQRIPMLDRVWNSRMSVRISHLPALVSGFRNLWFNAYAGTVAVLFVLFPLFFWRTDLHMSGVPVMPACLRVCVLFWDTVLV